MNADIRAFFLKTPQKEESTIIEKKTIDIAKDIKEIKAKPKEKKPKKANINKFKVQTLEPESPLNSESKDQFLKKKTKGSKVKLNPKEIQPETQNTPPTKSSSIINKKKRIIDDDVDVSDIIIVDQDNKATKEPLAIKEYKIEEPPKVITRQVIKPVQQKEKLININVSDFFSMTKEDVKKKFDELAPNSSDALHKDKDVEMKDVAEEVAVPKKEEDKREMEDKMEVDNDKDDSFVDINIDEIAKNIFEQKVIDINHTNAAPQTIPQQQSDIFKHRTLTKKPIEDKAEQLYPQMNKASTITKERIQPIREQKPIISAVKQEEVLYQLWAEKYKPKTQSEIIGNASAVKSLSDWLDHWDDVVLNGITREMPSSFGKGKKGIENLNARAAIVSGAPGIGKTSTVRLLASLKHYRAFELNASDQRNKNIINNSVGFLSNNKTLTADKEVTAKSLIIMDEVDGMGGNEDKGGIAALITIIKKSKVPIIFICNDIYCQKLKSLKTHCYDIRFNKPDRRQVVNRLYAICQKENVKIDQSTLDYLCGGFNCDIRQCLNFLELASKGNMSDLKEKAEKFKKDDGVVINSFEGCKRLLNKAESNKLSYTERMELFFVDYDLIPSLVHENYLSCYGNHNNSGDLNRIVEVSQALSYGDILDARIHHRNDWGLLSDKGIQSALIPSVVNGGSLGYPNFPELFAKMSKISKLKRQIREIKQFMPETALKSIKHEVAPLMFSIITNNLIAYGKEGIERIMRFFSQWKFTFAQIKDCLFDLQSESMMSIYTKINSGIKSALTKRINEQSNLNTIKEKKKTKKDKTVMHHQTIKRDLDGNLLEEIDQSSDKDDDDNEEESSSIFEAIPKVKKSKAKQKPTTN